MYGRKCTHDKSNESDSKSRPKIGRVHGKPVCLDLADRDVYFSGVYVYAEVA